MQNRAKQVTALCAGLLVLSAVGCASNNNIPESEAHRQLQEHQRDLAAAEAAIRDRDSEIESLSNQLSHASLPAVSSAPPRGDVAANASSTDMLPPSAKAGECYARVFVPPVYTTRQIEKLKRGQSERVEVVPATYEMTTKQVAVKEASSRLEIVPATYETVQDQVLVNEASFRLEEVPATFEWQEEQVLVRPAETKWKKGRGPIEKVDDATGEIMCLVDVPAKYETVRKRVLSTPATTTRIEIPEEYRTVERRVQKTPASTREIVIPAEFKTVKVRTLVQPAAEKRIAIPAEYQKVTQRELVTEGAMAWRPVLCETNASRATITSIQRALATAGHNPGPIDGIIGVETLGAVKSFQKEKDLPTGGGVSYATIDALGVTVSR